MTRPQKHLASVVKRYPSASGELYDILLRGLFSMNEKERADRIAAKGTDKKTNPHISDAQKCVRAVTYSLMNVEVSNPLTADSLMNFLLGRQVEMVFASILIAAGFEPVREEHVTIPIGGSKVTGRQDFSNVVLKRGDSIIELKSINSRAMGFLLKEGKPRPEHVSQTNLYLHATGCNNGEIVYFVKDGTKGEPVIHVFPVSYDPARAMADLRQMEIAVAHAAAGDPPPVPEALAGWKTWVCNYCAYKNRCMKDGGDLTPLLRQSIAAATPHVAPPRDSPAYESHRESCDTCYGAEMAEIAVKGVTHE